MCAAYGHGTRPRRGNPVGATENGFDVGHGTVSSSWPDADLRWNSTTRSTDMRVQSLIRVEPRSLKHSTSGLVPPVLWAEGQARQQSKSHAGNAKQGRTEAAAH
jgi:hypothetical protein